MTAPQYTIRTLQDMGQIPVDRIDAFLVDLRSCLLLGHGLSDMSDSFVKSIDSDLSCPCVPNELIWVDDGASDLLALHVEGEEDMLPQPIKHESIPGMVEGMHYFAKLIRDNAPDPKERGEVPLFVEGV